MNPDASLAELLSDYAAFFIDNLLVDDIIVILVDAGVISLYIHDNENYTNRARVLLQKLAALDEAKKEVFRESLMTTLQPHLAVLLGMPSRGTVCNFL